MEHKKISLERESMLVKKEKRKADRGEQKAEREEAISEMRAQRHIMVGITSQNAT